MNLCAMRRAMQALTIASVAACSRGPAALTPETARQAVRQVTLTQTDLGAGWQSTPLQPETVGNLDLAHCTGAVDLERDAITKPAKFAFSSGLDAGTLALVTGATTALSRSDLDRLFKTFTTRAFETCVVDEAKRAGTTGGRFEPSDVTTRERTFNGTEHGFELVIPFVADLRQSTSTGAGTDSSTTPLKGIVTLEFIGHHQFLTILGTFSIEGSVTASDVDRWATLLARRQTAI